METALAEELRSDLQHLPTLGVEHGALLDKIGHPVRGGQDIRGHRQDLVTLIGDHQGFALPLSPDPEWIVAETALRQQLLQSTILPLLPGRQFITSGEASTRPSNAAWVSTAGAA